MIRSLDKRIQGFLKDHPNELPWKLGCDPEKLSAPAKGVWETLTPIEKLSISKFCPYRLQAYWASYRLKKEGIRASILNEIAGIDRATLYRHLQKAKLV